MVRKFEPNQAIVLKPANLADEAEVRGTPRPAPARCPPRVSRPRR